MGKGTSKANVGSASGKSYEDFDKRVTDTVIVNRNGKYSIEQVGNRNLDEDFGQVREMNHSKLAEWAWNAKGGSIGYSKYDQEMAKDISLNDVYEYLKKHYNWKAGDK